MLISRAPIAAVIVRRDEAGKTFKPAATLDELTSGIPGLQVSNRENYALGERITIRGMGWRSPFGVRGIRVLLDHLPLTVADGQTIVTMADPAMIQRMEVLRGPSSTFYGNASGGVLSLETIPLPQDPLIQVRTYAESYKQNKQEVAWNVYNDKDLQIFGYGTRFRTAGYRDHSAATLYRAHAGTRWTINPNQKLLIHLHHTSMPFAEHPGALTQAMFDEDTAQARTNFKAAGAGKEFYQTMGGARYQNVRPGGTFEAKVHGTLRDLTNPLPFGTIFVKRKAGGLRASYTFDGLPLELQTGGEILFQLDERQNQAPSSAASSAATPQITLDQDEQVVNSAIFAQTRFATGPNTDVHGGIRADFVSYLAEPKVGDLADFGRDRRRFFSVNPSLGLIQRAGDQQFFVHLSSSFETPTTTELVNQPDGSGGFNREVKPERTLGVEAGTRLTSTRNNSTLNVTLYRMRVQNLLVPFEIDEDGREFFQNEGSSAHVGVELAAGLQLGSSTGVRVSLHLLRASFRDGPYKGNRLPGVPSAESSFQVRHENKFGAWLTEGFYRGDVPADREGIHEAGSFFRVQMAWESPMVRWRGSSLSLFFHIHNVLNESYVSSVNIDAFGGYFYEPGRPRSVSGGVKWRLDGR